MNYKEKIAYQKREAELKAKAEAKAKTKKPRIKYGVF